MREMFNLLLCASYVQDRVYFTLKRIKTSLRYCENVHLSMPVSI